MRRFANWRIMNIMEKVNSATFVNKHPPWLDDVHGVFIAMLSHLETRQDKHTFLYICIHCHVKSFRLLINWHDEFLWKWAPNHTDTHEHMHNKHIINVIRISLYQLFNIYTAFVGIGNSQMSRKLAEITFDLINLFTTSIGDEAIVAAFSLIAKWVICCFESTFDVVRLMSTRCQILVSIISDSTDND